MEEIEGERCFISQNDNSWLWHKRLSHLNFDNIVKISQTEVVRGMPKISKLVNKLCGSCQHENHVRTNFETKVYQAKSYPLEIVHTYLCGPMGTRTLQGELYFMLFIDDYSRMTSITFLKNKSMDFDKFKLFKAKVKKESWHKIKCLRSYNGG